MIHTLCSSPVFFPPHVLGLHILSNLGETAFKRCPYKSILLLKPRKPRKSFLCPSSDID